MIVPKPAMGTCIMTQNDCYAAYLKGRRIKPAGIVFHSTGANNSYLKRYVGPDDGVLGKNQYNNHWNQPDFKKCVHAFIGKAADGTPMIYQCLPWDARGWGVGSGSKGSYNDSHIQFEVCEDDLKHEGYWLAVRDLAARLCAWLCQEYGMPVENVVGHYEAHAAGYANNHGDPRNWMVKFGDSMTAFRADVHKMMGGVTPMPQHYYGFVQTKSDGKISLWNNADKGKRLAYIYDGEKVEVYGDNIKGTMAPARMASGLEGVADTQYLINRIPIDDTPDPEPEPGESVYGAFVQCVDASEAARMAEALGVVTGKPVSVRVLEG